MSDKDTPADPTEGERIDADHPRPGRRTPYRTGQGHGDDAVADTSPQAGVTGDDVDAGDESAAPSDDVARDDADTERYRDSPGAGLLRDDEVVPEPNEPA